jgi:hypothetical protein
MTGRKIRENQIRLVEQSRYAAVFKISVLSVWVKSEGSGRGWRVPTCPDV